MRNWAGNVTYRARRVHEPATHDELRAIVAKAANLRALGSRHTFNHLADADELVSVRGLPADVVLEDHCVTCNAGLTYGELAQHLDGRAALHNLASLPHISVGGAIATGTHGSGTGNLATAVRALQLVTSTGDVVEARRGEPDFDGMVVHLGRLGVVTRVTLDTEPHYEVTQRVFEGLSWEHVPDVFDAAYSVSVFTRLKGVDMVWLKARGTPPDTLFDATAATVERHPIMELDPVNCTRQLGVPGPWWDRLPHFRMGFTPSKGDELQAEYLLPREHAAAAIDALRALTLPGLLVCELRTVAADELWMSPMYGRDTFAVHFTFEPGPVPLDAIETALAPLQPRAHPGKLYLEPGRYDRSAEFSALAERLDSRGAFASSSSTSGDSGGGSAFT
ncbi:FAD-binding protein [Solirubrobacter sp. CPCC 204708]|uniref:FAD-binding protein n=1 Tax=Solirubrobacter deserti TaxID=2282478 RepID=A0ABT4RDV9_9ACTN|nr:FAD-binding protein [Solirubrobacter deserti]MBE2315970.1 FAD-binding protein [Solirubrobacter deserti]MDA0136721.1 FAD-binding protein [Solirubrobacter deserti]